MISYTKAQDSDLQQIINLQKQNLRSNLSQEVCVTDGFVYVIHTYDVLKKMNKQEPQIIAKDGDELVAYVLAMTADMRGCVPALSPMFELFEIILYNQQKICHYNYLVVGQVCVEKRYRGRNIFEHCYFAYREQFKNKYDFAITEISKHNTRSLRAHEKIGFKVIYEYVSENNEDWIIVLWDWTVQN